MLNETSTADISQWLTVLERKHITMADSPPVT